MSRSDFREYEDQREHEAVVRPTEEMARFSKLESLALLD